MKRIFTFFLSIFIILNLSAQVKMSKQISNSIHHSENVQPTSTKSVNDAFYENNFQAADPLVGMVSENVDGNTDNALIAGIPLNFSAGWIALYIPGETNVWVASNSLYETPGTADRWLITPAISITDSSLFSWQGLSIDVQGTGTAESYEVYVTTTIAGTTPTHSDFTGAPAFTIASENAIEFTSHEIDLKALGFVDVTVYIAFHHNSINQGILALDNLKAYKQSAPIVGGMEGDFENAEDFTLDLTPWTTVDLDLLPTYAIQDVSFTHSGEAMSYIVFNPSASTPAVTGMTTHGGDRLGACFAGVTTTAITHNDDWLISPKMVGETGVTLSFYAKSYTDTYGLERFNVGVSTTDSVPASFTSISTSPYVEAPVSEWTLFTYDLSTYVNVGQSFFIAINCVSSDAFIFLIDDIELTNCYPFEVNNVSNSQVSIYPNPATKMINVDNVRNSTILVYNMLGSVVASIENAQDHNAIEVSSFAQGAYILKIFTNDEVISKKFNIVK